MFDEKPPSAPSMEVEDGSHSAVPGAPRVAKTRDPLVAVPGHTFEPEPEFGVQGPTCYDRLEVEALADRYEADARVGVGENFGRRIIRCPYCQKWKEKRETRKGLLRAYDTHAAKCKGRDSRGAARRGGPVVPTAVEKVPKIVKVKVDVGHARVEFLSEESRGTARWNELKKRLDDERTMTKRIERSTRRLENLATADFGHARILAALLSRDALAETPANVRICVRCGETVRGSDGGERNVGLHGITVGGHGECPTLSVAEVKAVYSRIRAAE